MHIGSHEYANEADDDDVPKPAQSFGTYSGAETKIVLDNHLYTAVFSANAVSIIVFISH